MLKRLSSRNPTNPKTLEVYLFFPIQALLLKNHGESGASKLPELETYKFRQRFLKNTDPDFWLIVATKAFNKLKDERDNCRTQLPHLLEQPSPGHSKELPAGRRHNLSPLRVLKVEKP